MRRVHRVGLVLGVAWVATACVAALGLDDVTFTAHSTDAASDAPIEAAALDAPVETPSDAGTESSLPRSYWCDARADALFCDDFDDLSFLPDGAVPRGWSEILSTYPSDAGPQPTNGLFQIDPMFQSTPSSLRVQMGPSQAKCAYERLAKVLDTASAFGAVDLGYDIRIGDATGALTTNGNVIVSDLTIRADLDQATIYVLAGDTGTVGTTDLYTPLDGGIGTQGTNDLFSPTPFSATWIHVNVHLDLITSRYKLTFGTYPRGEQPLQHTIGRTASHVEAKIGISCSPLGAGPLEIRYDNVTLNVQ